MKNNRGLVYLDLVIIAIILTPLVKPTELSLENPQWIRIIAHICCFVITYLFSIIYLVAQSKNKLNITLYKYKGFRVLSSIFWGCFIFFWHVPVYPRKSSDCATGIYFFHHIFYFISICAAILFAAKEENLKLVSFC